MTPDVPTHQLALAMFSDFGINDVKISESPADFGFQKSDALINVADLSLVSRRAINALHFIASENATKGIWDVDLGYFKWLANFAGSRNDKHLRLALRESQKAAIQVSVIDSADSSKDIYASVPMLGTFVMAGGRLNFKLPEEIARLLQAPTDASYLSLRIGGAFTSAYAYSLYERLLRVREKGETGWMSVDAVKDWFKVASKKSLQEYKFLKRDVLKAAIDQINELSDIFVILEEKREMRRVTMVNFVVQRNPTFASRSSPLETELQKLYQTLSEEFGLSTSDFDEIMSRREVYTNRRIEQVIELVRHRRVKQDIKRPSAYFMKMLREGVMLSLTEKETVQRSEKKVVDEVKHQEKLTLQFEAANQQQADFLRLGNEIWTALDPEQRNELWQTYTRSLPGKTTLRKAKFSADMPIDEALENAVVRDGFFATLMSTAKQKKRA